MNYEQFKQESVPRFISNVTGYLKLTGDEIDYLTSIFEIELDLAKVNITTDIRPVKFDDYKRKLVASDRVIKGYHPVNGSWLHIIQVISPSGEIMYYTEGKRENV